MAQKEFKYISSRRNPLVRKIKSLSTKKGRMDHYSLLIEGTHLLEESIARNIIPSEILVTSDWIKKFFYAIEPIANETTIYEVTPEVLEASITTFNPDGIAAVIPLSALPKEKSNKSFILVLDNVQDPGNLGSLLRTALAADVDSVLMASGVDPLNQKAIRASAGAILKLPFKRYSDSEEKSKENLAKELKILKNNGFQLLATSAIKKNDPKKTIPYWEINWLLPTVLVLGNEGAGVDPLLKACCTHEITVPHSAEVESLNVAAVAVPLLFERRRAKMINEIESSQ